MFPKTLPFIIALALMLTACAQVVPATPPANPTAVPDQTTYPSPGDELVVSPTKTVVDTPYPEPQGNNAQPGGGENEIIELKQGINTEFAPQLGDLKLATGPAYVEIADSEAIMKAGNQATALHLVGNVPNPCYSLRVVVHEPDAQKRLNVEVYSVADPEKLCADMLQPFDETIALDTLAVGKYTVYINEEKLGPLEVK
jgi:hypothetical protein